MNSFDRFSRNYKPSSALTFPRPDASAVSAEARRERVSFGVSSDSSRSVYRLVRAGEFATSCVSIVSESTPTPRSLPVSFRPPERAVVSPPDSLGLAGLTLPQIERLAFLETLVACNGCRRLAARKLGVSEKTMYNKIKQYKLAAELDRLADRAPQEPIFN